jgi:CelD/BcsL family acetyltransferase involved in cellulose biosynthesis
MEISRIDTIDQFDQLRTAWERVHVADPYAHIFVSWTWLRGWFEMTPYSWSVLAVQNDSSSYVAFFPLAIKGPRIYQFRPIRVLHMGSKPLAASTGFVCLPEYEAMALTALASYIQEQLVWDRFQIEEILDPRIDLFLRCFPPEKFNVQQDYGMPSLYIPLPDKWEQYLQNFLGPKTRRNLRRAFRQLEGLNEFHLTHVEKDNLERDIDILLMFWQWRWGPKPMANWQHKILRHYFANNCLQLTILWNGLTPMAALASIIDKSKNAVYAYIVGHNIEFAKLSPGKVVFGYNIRSAIENNFQIYDFLLGGDNYKLTLGAKQRNTKNIIIARKGLRSNTANMLVNLTTQSGNSLKKILGKIKRIEIVKQSWFRLSALLKKDKR